MSTVVVSTEYQFDNLGIKLFCMNATNRVSSIFSCIPTVEKFYNLTPASPHCWLPVLHLPPASVPPRAVCLLPSPSVTSGSRNRVALNLYLVAQLLFLSFSILNWIPIQTTHDYLPNFYFLSFSIYIWIRIQASQDKKPCTFYNIKQKSIWIRISIQTISRGPTGQDNFYIQI